MKTTQQILDEIALQEGFRYFEDLMRHASLAYIQDRVKKAMLLFAEQFINSANGIISPATDILPDTYNEELDDWYMLLTNFKKLELK